MIQFIQVSFVAILVSIVVLLLTPKISLRLKNSKLSGTDIHKIGKPKIAFAGIELLLFTLIFLLAVLFITQTFQIIYIILVIALFTLYGLVDDIKNLNKYHKLSISILLSIFALSLANVSLLMLIPILIFVIFATSTFNLFAGLNGLEVGSAVIISFFFALCSGLLSNYIPFYLSLGFCLILLSFLFYNKYPAIILPGNAGTLLIGAFLASLAIYYNLYFILLPLLSLHILDAILKGYSAGFMSRKEKLPTRVNKKGILIPGNDYLSVIRLILRSKSLNETQVVKVIWLIEILIGVLVLSVIMVIR